MRHGVRWRLLQRQPGTLEGPPFNASDLAVGEELLAGRPDLDVIGDKVYR